MTRLLGRAFHRLSVLLGRGQDIDVWTLKERALETRINARMVAIASEIKACRLAVLQAREDPTGVTLQLRGHHVRLENLIEMDWATLGRGPESEINRDYEISYLSFMLAVPTSVNLAELGVFRKLDELGRANVWSRSLAWTPISVSNRLISLISMSSEFCVDGISNSFRQEILNHGDKCCGFLEENLETYLGFNHLVFNIVAILLWREWTGRFMPPRLVKMLFSTLSEQVLEDGGHVERSPTYHVHVIFLVRLLAGTSLSREHKLALDAIAKRMQTALSVMSHPDGDIALFNDSALNDAPPARLFLDDDELHPDVEVLVSFGMAKLKKGQDALIVDCGPLGPASNPGHGHADYLSCELSLDGERILVDPGTSSYRSGRARDHSRSSCSHNGPCFENVALAEFSGAFRVGRTSKVEVEAVASDSVAFICRPFSRPRNLLRRFAQMSQTSIVLRDTWMCSGGLRPRSRFLIAPQWWVEEQSHLGVRLRSASSGRHIRITVHRGSLRQVGSAESFANGPGAPATSLCLEFSPESDGNTAILDLEILKVVAEDAVKVHHKFADAAVC